MAATVFEQPAKVLEQPRELNGYVPDCVPFNWSAGWKLFKRLSPIAIPGSILITEKLAIRFWLSDENFVSHVPYLVFVLLLIPAMFLGVAAFQVFHDRSSKRMLKFKRRGVVTASPQKVIGWRMIRGWNIEPLPDNNELSRVTIEFARSKKAKIPSYWSIILKKPNQESEFLSALEKVRESGLCSAPVAHLQSPLVRKPEWIPPFRVTLAFGLGFFLLCNGLPYLAGPLSNSSPAELTPHQAAKLHAFLVQWFSSFEQERRFYFIAGSIVTGLSGILLAYAFYSLHTQKQAVLINESENAIFQK